MAGFDDVKEDEQGDGIHEILTDSDEEDEVARYRKMVNKRSNHILEEFKKLEIVWAEGGSRLKSRVSKRRTQIMKIVESDMHAIMVASRFVAPLATLALFPYVVQFVLKWRTNVLVDLIGAFIISSIMMSFIQAFYFRSAKRRLRDRVKEIKEEKLKIRREKQRRRLEEAKNKEITVSPFL